VKLEDLSLLLDATLAASGGPLTGRGAAHRVLGAAKQASRRQRA
jgi:hypothetical protein